MARTSKFAGTHGDISEAVRLEVEVLGTISNQRITLQTLHRRMDLLREHKVWIVGGNSDRKTWH